MDLGYRYGGEALFLIGVAARIIARLIRASREIQDGERAAPMLGTEQQARVVAMIADPPRIVDHRCPKCGTLIHADIVHGGFGPCRKCGWSPSSSAAAAS